MKLSQELYAHSFLLAFKILEYLQALLFFFAFWRNGIEIFVIVACSLETCKLTAILVGMYMETKC